MGASAPQEKPAAATAEMPPAEAKGQGQPVWKKALTHYELGDTKIALDLLKEAVHQCDGKCSSAELGTLYACVGIVLAGGSNDHNGAIVAFRKALSLDPEIIVLSVYQTVDVVAAYDEAKSGERQTSPAAPVVDQGSTSEAAPTIVYRQISENERNEEEQHAIELLKKRIIVLAAGTFQGGTASLNASTNNYIDIGGAYHLGGSFTVGGMPGQTSGFTMGARANGGIFLSDNTSEHFGVSAVLGGTIGQRQEHKFAYFLGGLGLQYFPGISASAASLSFQGGTSLGGLLVGGTVDMIIGSDVDIFLIGIDIGFGGLY